MLTPAGPARGFTLVEMVVVVAILGILIGLGASNYSAWIANSRIRTAADTLASGLSTARNEAIKRNRLVRFHLVSDLGAGCTLSSSGTSWVASLNDPTTTAGAKCDIAISDTDAPFIVAKKSATEQASRVTIAALNRAGDAADTIVFNGLGRVASRNTAMEQIAIDSSAVAGAETRELRIEVTDGGLIRLCDPSIATIGDTRRCELP
ncbi:GspH/FimT family pseudopilin [Accumulibacter sp.]|uniref:GspH/FimT family pseudopilin n=1 Tax=Accumulibacter sp. TaxID=2053492 RepID=UPI001A3FFD3E|nr:GspH/FimT family pseudopilin [Accumulibacter sp.]MBL8374203.1 GspH/FimT family pseudopilin [Accumulibacter sp.]